MPNRKTAKIEIYKLKCFSIIAREIAEQYPEYENYLIDEGVLHIKEYIPPTINDIDKVLDKLKFNYATRKYKYETYRDKELIDQKLLAKMAGVTRQTVARWEQMGFISRSDVGLSRDKYFQIKEVISQLEKLKE